MKSHADNAWVYPSEHACLLVMQKEKNLVYISCPVFASLSDRKNIPEMFY